MLVLVLCSWCKDADAADAGVTVVLLVEPVLTLPVDAGAVVLQCYWCC